jgi:ribosomal protein S18 acetylase RimI-like enzyme
LTQGWDGPGHYRIRLARPGDAAAVSELLALADVAAEDTLLEGIDTGQLGAGLAKAIEFGSKALLNDMDRLAFGDHGPRPLLIAQAALLVAVDRDGTLVGALSMLPPGNLLAQYSAAGMPYPHILSAMLSIAKISAIGVAPAARGRGLGEALLTCGVRLYAHAGYYLVYGSFRKRDQLAGFYTARGFQVLGRGEGIDLQPLLGTPTAMGVRPGPGERLFLRWTEPRD